MKKFLLLALALVALGGRAAYAAKCDGLACDSCPLFTLPDGTVAAEDPVEDCVVDASGAETLNCSCPDPPEGSTPANSRAAPATPSPNPPAGGGGGADDVNDLPPDGGSGAVIPTQSFGDPNSPNGAAATTSLSVAVLAAAAAAALWA